MEKENIKAAIDVLLTARNKYSQANPSSPQKLPGLKPENAGVQSNTSGKGQIRRVQLPAIGEDNGNAFVSDPSAKTLLLKPGLSNAQIVDLAIPGDLRLVPQISFIINDTIRKMGYTGREQLNPQQENKLAQAISVELQNFLSKYSNFTSQLVVK